MMQAQTIGKEFSHQIAANRKVFFIFAHYDDEFCLYPLIRDISINCEINFVYLTRVQNEKLHQRRKRRTEEVLNLLCVRQPHFYHVCEEPDIYDQASINNISDIFLRLTKLITGIDVIFTLDWEAGHPDHDTTYAICLNLTRRYAGARLYSSPAYNGRKGAIFPFSVMRPINSREGEGSLLIYKSWTRLDGLKYFFKVYTYPKQLKTFIGLGWGIFYRYFLVANLFIIQRQGEGEKISAPNILMAQRYKIDYAAFHNKINSFLANE